MRILVFSDTHGQTAAVYHAIEEGPCDMLLHLGDCVADCDELRMVYPRLDIRQVSGNDYRDVYSGVAPQNILELGGVRIYMTHGHHCQVRSGTEHLCALAAAQGARLALYGHTHIAAIGQRGGVTYCNPGSPSRSRDGAPSYGVITIENGKFTCEVIRL